MHGPLCAHDDSPQRITAGQEYSARLVLVHSKPVLRTCSGNALRNPDIVPGASSQEVSHTSFSVKLDLRRRCDAEPAITAEVDIIDTSQRLIPNSFSVCFAARANSTRRLGCHKFLLPFAALWMRPFFSRLVFGLSDPVDVPGAAGRREP